MIELGKTQAREYTTPQVNEARLPQVVENILFAENSEITAFIQGKPQEQQVFFTKTAKLMTIAAMIDIFGDQTAATFFEPELTSIPAGLQQGMTDLSARTLQKLKTVDIENLRSNPDAVNQLT